MSEIYNFDFFIELDNIDDANDHLKNGWKLINTYTTCDPILPGDERLIFVLGRIEDSNK